MPDRLQQVYRIPRKAADGLGEDNLNAASLTLLQHPVKLHPLFRPSTGNRVIGKHASVFPLRVLLNQVAVIGNLGGKGVAESLCVPGHAGISRHPLSLQNRWLARFYFCYFHTCPPPLAGITTGFF